MTEYIYPTVLAWLLYRKFKTPSHAERREIDILTDRINTLEKGFVFLDRDVNNGLEGGTAVSTQNRVIDGAGNPAYTYRSVYAGFIGQTLSPRVTIDTSVQLRIGRNGLMNGVHTTDIRLQSELLFGSLRLPSNVRGNVLSLIRNALGINGTYQRVIALDSTLTYCYDEYGGTGGSGGDANRYIVERTFETNRLWRYGQLISGRRLISSSDFSKNVFCVMDHNIDLVDQVRTLTTSGSNFLALHLERERSNVLVVTDEECEIIQSYLKCNFYTRDLGKLLFKRARGYSYLELPVDAVQARSGKLEFIFELRTMKPSLIYHQIGGI